jgi:radical SAM superfamily enzyme YgiQ (UPF0313 family)
MGIPSRLSILLVSPKGDLFAKSREFEDYARSSREIQTVFHFYNGLGAGLPLIAALTPGDCTVRIIDENQETIDFDTPCDIVGLTGVTQQAPRAYEIADQFRKRGRYVVMGGIHATCVPEDAGSHVDTVFIGEAERSWPLFVEEFNRGRPRKIYNQQEFPDIDMSEIPCPRFDLVAKYTYPVVWIQSTRGCPHDCEFCAASKIYGRKYKRKRVQQVVREIVEAKKYWKFAQIGFADDNMFVNRRYSRELIEELKKMSFTWYAQSDISIAEDEELLSEMRSSGCRLVLVGFESVDKDNLKDLDTQQWKVSMFDKYPAYIDRIQQHGIGIYGTFILGLDGDNRDTVGKTAEFVRENNMMGAQMTILTPFPGSRLRERLEKEKRIVHSDWVWYTGWNPVIRHANFTTAELQQDLLRFYRGIFDRESFARRAQYFRSIGKKLIERDG